MQHAARKGRKEKQAVRSCTTDSLCSLAATNTSCILLPTFQTNFHEQHACAAHLPPGKATPTFLLPTTPLPPLPASLTRFSLYSISLKLCVVCGVRHVLLRLKKNYLLLRQHVEEEGGGEGRRREGEGGRNRGQGGRAAAWQAWQAKGWKETGRGRREHTAAAHEKLNTSACAFPHAFALAGSVGMTYVMKKKRKAAGTIFPPLLTKLGKTSLHLRRASGTWQHYSMFLPHPPLAAIYT